jgi:ankyrin repeat protein
VTPAQSIAAQAKFTIEANPQKHQKIQALQKDENAFFEYFIRKVKKNDYLKVSYILNHCFDNAVARANFGNRSDENKYTAYHHAASLGHREILIILNDKRPFHTVQKFFLFTVKNNKEQTPLDLCCLRGNQQGNIDCFLEIWDRVGKSNHYPMLSLGSACIGGSVEIVKHFLEHPKCDPNDERINKIFNETRNFTKNAKICKLLYRKKNPNSPLQRAVYENNINLLKKYIDRKGVDINKPDKYGWVILDRFSPKCFSKKDAYNMFSILIKNGIDLLACNGNGKCPFIQNILPFFFWNGWHDLLDLVEATLSKQISEENYSEILCQVAEKGNKQCFYFFLQMFQINGEKLANTCLQPLGNKESAFFIALEREHFSLAKEMIHLGVDVNAEDESGATALNYAMAADDIDFVQFLLEQPLIGITAEALHTIAQYGSSRVIELILNLNVLDINEKDSDGDTPLKIAVEQLDDVESKKALGAFILIIKCLLKHGAMVDDVIITDVEKLGNDREFYSSKCKELLPILKKHQELTQCKKEIETIRLQIQGLNHRHLRKFHNSFNTDALIGKALNFINDCMAKNANKTETSRDDIEEILDKIRREKYIDFFALRLYIILQQAFDFKYQSLVCDRYPASSSLTTKPDQDFYFTFLLLDNKEHFIQLTQIEQKPTNYLITTLVYEATRHGFDKVESRLHHLLLSKIDPRFKKYNLEDYKRELLAVESSTGYSAENLSDDSDSEEEAQWQKEPPRKKMLLSTSAENLLSRFGDNSVLKKNGDFKKAASTDHLQLQQIHRQKALTSQQQRDLDSLNAHVYRKTLTPDTLKTISTKFAIAQYRGIAYRTDQFSRKERQKHRVKNEIGSPVLCTAATSQANPVEFAKTMQSQLFALKKSGPVFTRFNDGYQFANALEALQDFYSKEYEKFHATSKAFFDKLNSGNDYTITTLEETLLLNVSTDRNPFISTSDTPDHALRYAYESKYYDSFKDLRLRPRWQSSGQAERPYSGKVYLSLHDPLELNDLSSHVPSLNQAGNLAIDNQTLPERETSFCAFIPEGKVISQLVAKFPSFHHDYKEIYLNKYGLDRKLFEQFRKAILDTKPHTEENRRYKTLLTEHLICFQEVGLIEEARIAAERQGKILLYRNSNGGFGLFPSETTEPTRGKDRVRVEAAQEKRKQINESRKQNRSTPNVDGFLENLIRDFNIKCHAGTWSLKDIVLRMFEWPEGAEIDNQEQWLKKLTSEYQLFIQVHSLENPGNPSNYGDSKNPDHIYLYNFGSNRFAQLIKKEPF